MKEDTVSESEQCAHKFTIENWMREERCAFCNAYMPAVRRARALAAAAKSKVSAQ